MFKKNVLMVLVMMLSVVLLLAGCKGKEERVLPETEAAALATYVPPGELDEYYMFASGGHSGQVYVVGIPSMRLIRIVPVFTPDVATGYGIDEGTKKMLGGLIWGDAHHPNFSETKGEYDGRWLFINDNANARIARINLKTFYTEEILGPIPNLIGTHAGAFVTPNTEYVFTATRFSIPIPHYTYASAEQYKDRYKACVAAISVHPQTGKMDVAWEVAFPPVDFDLSDAGKEVSYGWTFFTCYNSEMAHKDLEVEASQKDRDFILALNWKVAEQAAKDPSKYSMIGGVKVIDPTKAPGIAYWVPCPKSPHGVDVSPDGKYFIGGGKLSPVVAVFDFEKLQKAIEAKDFEGDFSGVPVVRYESVNVAEVPVGLGPLHTQFDDKGYAYTSLFVESAVAKWKLGTWEVVDKIQVHYNIGHLVTAEGDSRSPDGKYLVALNKLSKDRFLGVGPSHPENHQLIDISGEKMTLLYDSPSQPEPHYAVMIKADKLSTLKVFPKEEGRPNSVWQAEDTKVVRQGAKVDVYMIAVRSHFTPDIVEVNQGDEVYFHITNIENDVDITHGFAICLYNVDMQVEPGETRTVKIVANKPGVFPFYCTNFCSALHQEMQGYLLVKPKL